jgi:hypothetical protein
MSHLTAEERFWAKVDKSAGPDGCWPWLAARQPGRYGQFSLTHRCQIGAHRFAYELSAGPIPDGLVIDHLCRNPICVNPAHLEAVTGRQNLMRGETLAAANAAKTHCPHGHKYDEANTRVGPSGKRTCRICAREWMREWREANRSGSSPD